jgi:hypothetical protein
MLATARCGAAGGASARALAACSAARRGASRVAPGLAWTLVVACVLLAAEVNAREAAQPWASAPEAALGALGSCCALLAAGACAATLRVRTAAAAGSTAAPRILAPLPRRRAGRAPGAHHARCYCTADAPCRARVRAAQAAEFEELLARLQLPVATASDVVSAERALQAWEVLLAGRIAARRSGVLCADAA